MTDITPDQVADEDRVPVLSSTEEFERALQQVDPTYELVLYVAGAAPRSLRAIANVRRLCTEYLPDCHALQVVDIYQEPALAERDAILAVPALIKRRPLPMQRLVGDMTDSERVLDGLGVMRTARGTGR
jgi:circadian clock protein KaiB